ncbi:hypothetical protein KKB64_04045 [Patescibacteria group bacterium]|nr:hypothetical protein [Patescibacteria group bacterium]MBU1472930.1 hypothetical protein [Patescibacteria group bacterium]
MTRRVVVLLSALFLLFALLPTWYEIAHRGRLKPIREFELVHNFPTDYNFYLSRIREGLEGRWTVVEKYTSEPHRGSLIQEFYLLTGQVGRVAGVEPHDAWRVYHAARIILGLALLLMIGEYCRKSFEGSIKGEQILAFLLVVTASSWPVVVHEAGGLQFYGHMRWWSVMDPLLRIPFVPHFLIGQIFILYIIATASEASFRTYPLRWLWAGMWSLVLGFVFPPALVVAILALIVQAVLELYSNKKYQKRLSLWIYGSVFPRMTVGLIGIPSLLYIQMMTRADPWSRLLTHHVLHPTTYDPWEYILAIGPVLPLGLLGLVLAIGRKERRMMSLVSWVTAWAVFGIFSYPFTQMFPLRFSQLGPHIPLGILTAYVFYVLAKRAEVANENFDGSPVGLPALFSSLIPNTITLIPIFIILLGLGSMYSTYLAQKDFVDHKIRADIPLVPTGTYVMYPLKDFVAALRYLEANTKRSEIVLSETTAGNYIPAYSGNTVFVGQDNTLHAEEKWVLVRTFFSGMMKSNQARDFMEKNHLRYVFFGPQEKDDGGIDDLRKVYPFLEEMYKNEYVTIYRVNH